MKRIQFYTCPACGNILTATGGAEIACCGRKLGAMKARACDETHALHVEEMDGECPVPQDALKICEMLSIDGELLDDIRGAY